MDVSVCVCVWERERERELKVFKFVINGTNFGYYIIVKLKGHFLLERRDFTSLSIILLQILL